MYTLQATVFTVRRPNFLETTLCLGSNYVTSGSGCWNVSGRVESS